MAAGAFVVLITFIVCYIINLGANIVNNHQTDTFLNKKTMYHAQKTQTDKTTDCGYLGTGSRNTLLSSCSDGSFEGKEWHLRGKGMAL